MNNNISNFSNFNQAYYLLDQQGKVDSVGSSQHRRLVTKWTDIFHSDKTLSWSVQELIEAIVEGEERLLELATAI